MICLVAMLMLAGCSSKDSGSTGKPETVQNVSSENKPDVKADDASLDKVKLVKEYIYKKGDYVKHLLILDNENDAIAWVNAESKAYDSEEKLIGAGEGDAFIGAHSVGIVEQSIKNIDGVHSFVNDFSLKDNTAGFGEIHSFLSYEPTILDDKVLIETKYVGDIEPTQAIFHVLFLDSEGQLLDHEDEMIHDLRPGEEKTIQVDADVQFDDAIVILEGYSIEEVKLIDGEDISSSSSPSSLIDDFKEIGSDLVGVGSEITGIFTDTFSEAFGDVLGGSSDGKKKPEESNETISEPVKEEETEQIEYIQATVDEMYQKLNDNALKANKTYKDKYVEVTGNLGTIDSNGSYICLEEMNTEYSFYSVQCYIKNDEQLNHVLDMSSGKKYTVRVKITMAGEVLGYSGDIIEFLD